MSDDSTRSFAIVPAAGRGRRMGTHKLLMPWRGGSLIESVIASWLASRVTQVVVVARADDVPLGQVCRDLGAQVVTAAVAPPEMKDSVMLGLDYVSRHWNPDDSDVWLLAPADMPNLSAAVVNALLNEHRVADPAILTPVISRRRGHPVLFPWSLSREVAKLGEGQGVSHLLQRHPVRSIACEDPAILEDVDTPEDYRRLHGE